MHKRVFFLFFFSERVQIIGVELNNWTSSGFIKTLPAR